MKGNRHFVPLLQQSPQADFRTKLRRTTSHYRPLFLKFQVGLRGSRRVLEKKLKQNQHRVPFCIWFVASLATQPMQMSYIFVHPMSRCILSANKRTWKKSIILFRGAM